MSYFNDAAVRSVIAKVQRHVALSKRGLAQVAVKHVQDPRHEDGLGRLCKEKHDVAAEPPRLEKRLLAQTLLDNLYRLSLNFSSDRVPREVVLSELGSSQQKLHTLGQVGINSSLEASQCRLKPGDDRLHLVGVLGSQCEFNPFHAPLVICHQQVRSLPAPLRMLFG
jgi:hypothetical protein